MAAFRKGKTTVELAAMEPHVINLVDFLRSLGIRIDIGIDHTLVIYGSIIDRRIAETTVICDYIESGTFVVLGALTAAPSIRIE